MTKRRAYRVQEPPITLKVEMTEGCNLRCTFCGLQGIRAPGVKDYKFMTEATLRGLFAQVAALGWTPRVEFTMHGEPTMNPQRDALVAAARELCPGLHLMMTSNGGGLLGKPGILINVASLFRAGLNFLALDDYEGANIVPKVRAALRAKLVDETNVQLDNGPPIEIYDYPADERGHPHRPKRGRRVISFLQDLLISASKKQGSHSFASNHTGAAAPPNTDGAGKRCHRPFREMTVRWDGRMSICCDDWRGKYPIGAVADIAAAWQSAAMGAARERLYRGQRDFGACAGCDSRSTRAGLLPDRMGKATLHKPDAQTASDVAAAVALGPLTVPHLRPWEGGK